MRNLRIVSFRDTDLNNDLPLSATAWDTTNDSTICAFGPTSTRPIIELKRKTTLEQPETHDGVTVASRLTSITSWDAPCPLPDLLTDEIVLMHYFSDTMTVCLVLAGGDLILVREEPEEGQERIEIVGSIDVGIAAAAWAPDEELLAIVTRSDNLVLMSRDLEPVTETMMSSDDLKASKHVSVGWGKKETQFQGKRAKALRDPTVPEHVDEGLPSRYEDGSVNISWRGDGAFLAVNAAVLNHRRIIRVYSREGLLDSVSEPVNGLESALSWRPSGNLIAGVKRSEQNGDTNIEIVFFERNGLRHGEFALRLQSSDLSQVETQISLSWNIDSSVLAISFADRVQYWTMGNYHYYLKQEVQVVTEGHNRAADQVWHPEKPLKSSIGYSKSLIDLEFQLHVNRGTTVKPNDFGVAAVVDGTTLKLTPLRHAGVPPPMAFCEVTTASNIVDVASSRDGSCLAILTTTGIEICDWHMVSVGNHAQQTQLRHTTQIDQHHIRWTELEMPLPQDTRFTQIAFRNKTDIFILAPSQKGSKALCIQLTLQEDSEGRDNRLSRASVLDISNDVQTLLTDNLQETLWVQNERNTIAIGNAIEIEASSNGTLPGGQPNCAIYQVSRAVHTDITNGFHSSFHKVSLTTKGSLLADQHVLARDCTSFVLTDLYLIYTTAQHLLKFIHLTHPDKMDVPGDTPEVDERCRSIERGAKIVTAIPSIYAVVLQMPRGNLETIYPRVLVLSGIRESIRNLNYRTAFLACQTHQVDMNILHDFSPESFMSNIQKFIEDLKNPVRVDEFLSKLKEEDVSQTLYKDTLYALSGTNTDLTNNLNHQSSASSKVGSEKVNAICDAFISSLENRPGKFLQCIITAHVCKRPPDLAAALTHVSSLRQTSSEEADLAVSHLCFLTDTNRLYDAALALYDLELTLLVAQNAQRDPREYMPFLQNLQSLPVLRRRYQIDNHLRNHSKALSSLHALEAHEEVEAYTVKHILYTTAMDLYKYTSTHLMKITKLYATYLASQSQHASAATLYESLNLFEEAYPLYALAHQWRECLTCANLIPLPQDKLQQLAVSLATTLAEESRDYRSAATIHTDYLSDPTTASRLLCKGSYFAEATRLLALHDLTTQIPSTIDTALGDKFSEILELVTDCKSQLSAQVPRIQDLRQKARDDPLAFFGGDAAENGVDVSDTISLAPTDATTAGGQTLFTRYGGSQNSRFAGTVASNVSRKTSKTRRREERKRARGKKGSVYEEEYLVASVGRLIERVNGVHDEVGRLVSGLLRRGMREQARKVGEVMLEVSRACEKAKRDVWVVDGSGVGTGEHRARDTDVVAARGVANAEYRPVGADGMFDDGQQVDGMAKKESPVVKAWKDNPLVMR